MSKRTRGFVLLAAGALLAVIAAGADAFGIGPHPAFGIKQIVGTVVGIGVAVMGLRDLRG